MTDPVTPVPPRGSSRAVLTPLTDGNWHRLHPATPLLRGGIFVVAVLGFVIANLRERLFEIFFNEPHLGGDPIDEIMRRGAVGWALLGVLVILVVILVVFYLSWRMHSFRVSDVAVEVRSGLVFRSNRKARLDRIQGINLVRPFIPRLFGAARLDVSVGGQDGSVQLAYLHSRSADDLRRDILRIASGIRQDAAAPSVGANGDPGAAGDPGGAGVPGGPGVPGAADGTDATDAFGAPLTARTGMAGSLGTAATTRVQEFLAPELDPDAAPPESVVRIPPGRLIGSIVLSGFTVFLILALIGLLIAVVGGGRTFLLFAILPGIIGTLGYYFSRITKSLRYSIAGTPDGVRVGFGLLSTSSETLPPGRIHAVGISQPLLWRPFGWWQVQINKAGHSSAEGAAGAASTLTLPVGTPDDVVRVLQLLLPGCDSAEHRSLILTGMTGTGGTPTDPDGFCNAPRRARWVRPFSWRRTGYTTVGGVALIRHGVISRDLIVVPLARLQSIALHQGPIARRLRLGSARLHTVLGPVSARLSVMDVDESERFFTVISAEAVTQAAQDTSHHWRQFPAPTMIGAVPVPVPPVPGADAVPGLVPIPAPILTARRGTAESPQPLAPPASPAPPATGAPS